MLTLAFGASPSRALPGTPRRVTRVAGLCLGVVVGLGCERRAPGPEECLQFADVWLAGQPQRQPRLVAEAAFDELVRRCLTEPFDRELVSCVVGGAPRERCRVEYERRLEAHR